MIRKTLVGQVVMLLLATTAAATAEEYWLRASPENCEIWSDQPTQGGDVITWSGGCIDGKTNGNGLLLWMRNGKLHTSFDGDMSGGKMNGKGALVEASGSSGQYDVVVGKFRNSEPKGAILFKSAENAFFVGQYQNGKMDGQIL